MAATAGITPMPHSERHRMKASISIAVCASVPHFSWHSKNVCSPIPPSIPIAGSKVTPSKTSWSTTAPSKVVLHTPFSVHPYPWQAWEGNRSTRDTPMGIHVCTQPFWGTETHTQPTGITHPHLALGGCANLSPAYTRGAHRTPCTRRADAVRIVGRAGMTRGQGGRSGAAAPNNGTRQGAIFDRARPLGRAHRGSLETD